MINNQPDKQFWDLADSFINLANEHCNTVPQSKVSVSLLYATARFNAFIVYSNTKNKEEFLADKEAAISYFLEQYEKMLRENLEDHEKNFEKYRQIL